MKVFLIIRAALQHQSQKRLRFRPNPERIGDESLIERSSRLVLTKYRYRNREITTYSIRSLQYSLSRQQKAAKRLIFSRPCYVYSFFGVNLCSRTYLSRAQRRALRPYHHQYTRSPDLFSHRGAAFHKAAWSEHGHRRHRSGDQLQWHHRSH